MPNLVPELNVGNFERSLWFYCDLIGFCVLYDRPEQKFAMLDLNGARLMIEEIERPYTTLFATGNEAPEYSRIMNLEIQVSDIEAVHARVLAAGLPLLVEMKDRIFRVGIGPVKVRQFVVADPDGFVIRPQIEIVGGP